MSEKDLDIWVVKLWKEDEFDDELLLYPNYVVWLLRNRLMKDKQWPKTSNFFDEGYRSHVDFVGGYACLVTYNSWRVEGGMRAPTGEEVEEAIRDGRVIDLTPNEERMREYEIYKWWVDKFTEFEVMVKSKIEELIRDISNFW